MKRTSTVADLRGRKSDRATPPPPLLQEFVFRAETNEKRVHTTSDEPQKVIFTYDRPPSRKSPLLRKILDPPMDLSYLIDHR